MEEEVKLSRRYGMVLSLLGVIFSIGLYLYWAASYDAWTDLGLYSIVISLGGISASALFLFSIKDEDQ
jgi:hypothetical protein